MARGKDSREENNGSESLHTAAQLSAAAEISRQSVFKHLRDCPPTSQVTRSGRLVNAWAHGDLPEALLDRIKQSAESRGALCLEHQLSHPVEKWEPPIPVTEIRERYLDKASTLKQALRPTLDRLNDPSIARAELERMGLADYRSVFGHSISMRHFRRILKRTLKRDAGAEDWGRIEIYVDDNVSRKPPETPVQKSCKREDLAGLQSAINAVRDIARPTSTEKALIWVYAFEALEVQILKGSKASRAKRDMVDLLQERVPFLAKNRKALRRCFDRKYRQWAEGERNTKAIEDQRPQMSGYKRVPELTEEDRQKLCARAVKCGGRETQAWRELMQEHALSADITTHYLSSGSSKSYMPHRIRDAIKYDVKILMEHEHGPHQAKVNGAYIERDPSGYCAGDWFQGDDTTLPIYFFDPERPHNPLRGQFLIEIDCRSTYILGFVLICDKSYNARDVRNLITTVHDSYGLPNEGFYFERGSWKARLLKGDPKAEEKGGVPWADTEQGLRALGLRFMHAREARAKIVERVFGSIQNYMERDIGYCGRDERHDRFERVQKHLQLVRSGRNPGEFFMSRDELCGRLQEICKLYNAERQDGKRLQGRSPKEAFQEFYGVPLTRLTGETRYLLANYVKKARITRNGICFRFGKESYRYADENTGRLQGQQVLTWFSPEHPELLSVTDLNRENPFTVERVLPIPEMTATDEQLAHAHSVVAAHNAYGKRLYRSIRPEFPDDFKKRMFTRTIVAPQDAELGREMQRQIHEADEHRKTEKRNRQHVNRLAARTGVTVTSDVGRRADQAEAIPELEAFLKTARADDGDRENL